jgi:Rrf2 family protein
MNVGRRVDYAVRALSFLAGQPAGMIVSRAEIEKSQDIPSFYLSKIMKDLVAGGLVRSHIGSKGGFSLAKLATGISIKDVYETVERPLVLMDCLEKGTDYCSIVRLYTEVDLGRGSEGSFGVPKNLHQRYADRQGLKGRLVGSLQKVG